MKWKLSFLVIILCFISESAIGQRYNLRKKNTIDFVFGLDYGFRAIKGDERAPQVATLLDNRRGQEIPKLNYRIGFNYTFYLSETLMLKSGLRFTNPGFRTGLISTYDPTVDINEFPKQWDRNGNRYQFNYLFVEIPMMLRYVYSKNWCKSYVEFGLSSNIYMKSLILERIIEEEAVNKSFVTEDINRFNVLVNFAIGAEMQLDRNFVSFVQLMTRYQLTNLRKSQLKEYIGGLGIESGVRFAF